MTRDDDLLAVGLFLAIMGFVPVIPFGSLLTETADASVRPVAVAAATVLPVARADRLGDLVNDGEFDSRREAILTIGGNLVVHASIWLLPDAVVGPAVDTITSVVVGASLGSVVAGLVFDGRWLRSGTGRETRAG